MVQPGEGGEVGANYPTSHASLISSTCRHHPNPEPFLPAGLWKFGSLVELVPTSGSAHY